jgi:hypothetical protein
MQHLSWGQERYVLRQREPGPYQVRQDAEQHGVFVYDDDDLLVRISNIRDTHWGIMALNLALFTTMWERDFLHTLTISLPMFSPSRSQSVQIIRVSAVRASVNRFRSILLLSAGTALWIGASNSVIGSQEFHCLYCSGKSWASKWPETEVTVKCELVCG